MLFRVLCAFLCLSYAVPAFGLDASYSYDNAGRLTLEQLGNVRVEYSYDAAGNLLSQTSCIADCYIDGACYADGDPNPMDACEVCDATTPDAFTPLANCVGADMGGADMGDADMGGADMGGADMGGNPADTGTGTPDSGSTPDTGPDGNDTGGGGVTPGEKGGCSCGMVGGGYDALPLLLFAFFVVSRRRRRRRPFAALAATLTLLVPGIAGASSVCQDGSCDFTSIGQAIQNAGVNETITVKSNGDVYMESGLSIGGNMTLTSTNPDDPTGVIIDGGANDVVLVSGGGALIEGVTIRNGRAQGAPGGGVQLGGGVAYFHKVVIENNNAGSYTGGGIGANVPTTVVLMSSTVRNNRAFQGGGGIGGAIAQLYLIDSTVDGNEAAGTAATGGGIGFLQSVVQYVEIRNSDIINNKATATDLGVGGGMFLSAGSAYIVDTSFDGNAATGTTFGSQAGGLGLGTGTYSRLENVTLSGNSATGGGGLYLDFGTARVELIGTNISGNTAATVGDGGGILCNGGEIVALTGTVSGNMQDETAGCAMCTVGATEACTTNLPGVCAPGQRTCGALGFWEECVATTTGTPSEQLCMDGTDDDCDGATDAADSDCQSARPTTVSQVRDGSGTRKDPVSTFTGEFFTELKPDLALGGPLRMEFTRYYASGLDALGLSGTLGTNWRHSLEWSLIDGGTTVTVITDEGRRIEFEQVGGEWKLARFTDVAYAMLRQSNGWIMFDPRTRFHYRFNAAGVLTAIRHGHGNSPQRIAMTYVAGQLVQADDELGRVLTFTYDGGGLLTSVSDGTRTFNYMHTGTDLTQVVDAASNSWTYAYASGGLLTSWTSPGGNTPFTQTYNAAGRVATQTDSDGNTTTFTYNDAAGTCAIADATGTITHTHDQRGALQQVSWPGGQTLGLKYDADGRRSETTSSAGGSFARSFDPDSGKPTSVTLADGTSFTTELVTRFDRAMFHEEVGAMHFPDGSSMFIAYDAVGNITEVMDRLGNTSTYTYDDRRRTLTSTDEVGATTTYTWVDAGVATETDNAGNTTSHSYDALGRRTTTTYPDGTSTSWTYDDKDNITSITNEKGVTRTYAFDADGKLDSTTDGDGNQKFLTWDAQGRLATFTDGLGVGSSVTYDVNGDVATQTNREGETTTFTRNAQGRITRIDGPGGRSWDFGLRADGLVGTVSDPMGNTTTYDYDVVGRTTSVQTPTGASTTFTYDAHGRPLTITDPLGNVTTKQYDAQGRVTRLELPGSIASSYTRNALGAITAVTDPNGNMWSFEYDLTGRLIALTDPLGNQTSRAYDGRDRVATVTWPGGLGTVTVTRDDFGKITNQSYDSGLSISRGYDGRNLLTSADRLTLDYDANGMIVESNGVTHTRDGAGRVETVTFAAGNVATYTYDAAGDLQEITDWLGNSTTFNYDAAGRRTQILRHNGVDATIAYDADDFVTGVEEASSTGTLSSIALVRDARGNIMSATRDLPEAPALPADRQLTLDAASQVASFGYDALGRRTSDDARTYSWDAASRLTSYTEGGQTVTFEHSGVFQLVSRTVGGTTEEFVWDYGTHRPSVAATRVNGVDERYYVRTHEGDLLYSIDAATGATRHYHFDEAGNTLFVTDDAGTITHSYAYTAYGELTGSTGPDDNPFTYGGRYSVIREPGTSLYTMGRRVYDSATKRFISREPVPEYSHPLLINPYAYAAGNPLRFVDPSGESPTSTGQTNTASRALQVGAGVAHLGAAAVGDRLADAADATRTAESVNAFRAWRGGTNPPGVDRQLASAQRLEARKGLLKGANRGLKLLKLGVDGQKEGPAAVGEFLAKEGAEMLTERFGRGRLRGPFGSGLVGAVFEAAKANEDMGKITSEQADSNALLEGNIDEMLRLAKRLLDAKTISPEQYEAIVRLALGGYADGNAANLKLAKTGIVARTLEAWAVGILGAFGL